MHSDNFLQIFGSIMSIVGGFFLGTGHLLNLLAQLEDGTVIGKSLILIGHLVLTFAFIAFYDVQRNRNGFTSKWGLVTSIVGTAFVTAVVFVELAGISGVAQSGILEKGITGNIATIGPLFFVIGMILVGISIIKNDILPKAGGVCLLIGTLIFGSATFLPDLSAIISFIGGTITGIGFIVLGGFLFVNNKRTRQV